MVSSTIGLTGGATASTRQFGAAACAGYRRCKHVIAGRLSDICSDYMYHASCFGLVSSIRHTLSGITRRVPMRQSLGVVAR